MQQNTILGIDPGTKEMGIAIIRGTQLISFGVHTLRNGHRPHDLVGQARRIVLAAIEEHGPHVVAIEKPYALPTKRAAILSVIAQELRGRAEDLGLHVIELAPEAVRQAVVGDPRATKIDVAEKLVAGEFGQLADLVPKRPARAALGMRPRDRYWLHVFDALGLAVAARGRTTSESRR
jgi:Holliday junction resolvasome RuvABC endonuclease subunit